MRIVFIVLAAIGLFQLLVVGARPCGDPRNKAALDAATERLLCR